MSSFFDYSFGQSSSIRTVNSTNNQSNLANTGQSVVSNPPGGFGGSTPQQQSKNAITLQTSSMSPGGSSLTATAANSSIPSSLQTPFNSVAPPASNPQLSSTPFNHSQYLASQQTTLPKVTAPIQYGNSSVGSYGLGGTNSSIQSAGTVSLSGAPNTGGQFNHGSLAHPSSFAATLGNSFMPIPLQSSPLSSQQLLYAFCL
jgi:hypothetical protein